MVLEAVCLCLDNSEWMRNGDYVPTRLAAQSEAASYITTLKVQSNVENVVGLLTTAGKRIDVRMTPTQDVGAIMSSLQSIAVGGQANLLAAIKTAQLCLKNRQNKNQRQRIILFVGSPIEHQAKDLVKLGKQLKKNNVAVDVINFGQENTENENSEKLDAFVNAVNSNENSRLVNVPPGPHNLGDMIITAIMGEERGAVPMGGGMSGEGGMIDPNMDPELAMAIRMSLEEERERQERAARAEKSGDAADVAMEDPDSEEAQLAKAIAMSMAADNDVTMQESTSPQASSSGVDVNALNDPAFVENIIASLPDVSAEDIDVNDLLNGLNEEKTEEDKDKKKKSSSKK